MATITQIKTNNDTTIRQKVLPGSITKTQDADLRDQVADELKDRGALKVETTGALAGVSKDNTSLVLVRDVGFFVPLNTGSAADGENTFASATSGWLWEKWIDTSVKDGMVRLVASGNTTHVLTDVIVYDLLMKSTNADTVKVGTTSGGEEIVPEVTLTANEWYPASVYVIASGASKTLFFNGFTGDEEILIYKRKLPVVT